MKLLEALEILKESRPEELGTVRMFLVCGFSPLHLQTFLEAHFRLAIPDRDVTVLSGLYGDFWGNLNKLEKAEVSLGAIALEWSDLDPRLGFRSLGSWAPSVLSEIVSYAQSRIARFIDAIERISRQTTVVICLPTIPLPPISFSPGWLAGNFELELRSMLYSAGVQLGRIANVKLINASRLDQMSEPASRFDLKSEMAFGFPYKVPHASAMAELICRAALPPTPKKGIISDLDDTLWQGILGEVGAEGIFWDLEHDGQIHGLYQRLLHSLSEAGVLIAAASKNDARIVDQALERDDLVLPSDVIFPVEAHWGPKSESVARILQTWNIGADAVIFIDDSPMELAEVKNAYPDIECILFPKNNPQALLEILYHLRDRFGKQVLSEEDNLRRVSIRSAAEHAPARNLSNGNLDDFLAQSEAELTFSFSKDPIDPRALELINKTNQFNLNGKRFVDSEWQNYLKQPDTFLLIATHRDKYGPSGKIAVMAGRKKDGRLLLDVWVMSCRVFSRRIEHQCLSELFRIHQVGAIEFDFRMTPKNGPLQEFLEEILTVPLVPGCHLSKTEFLERKQRTFHHVLEVANG